MTVSVWFVRRELLKSMGGFCLPSKDAGCTRKEKGTLSLSHATQKKPAPSEATYLPERTLNNVPTA